MYFASRREAKEKQSAMHNEDGKKAQTVEQLIICCNKEIVRECESARASFDFRTYFIGFLLFDDFVDYNRTQIRNRLSWTH